MKPSDAIKVADAIVRVFIDLGDRTNRLKARLKYVIDGMGMEKFSSSSKKKPGYAFTRVPPEALAPRPAFDRTAHIGVHEQKQAALNWIYVALAGRKAPASRCGACQNLAGSRRRRTPG